MALKDVKEYYFKMQKQYLEMKRDLADFEQALKDGHITEDQLDAVKEDVFNIENNYDRITYIMFLFEKPKRSSKLKWHKKQDKKLYDFFEENGSNTDAILNENESVLGKLREDLKKLRKI